MHTEAPKTTLRVQNRPKTHTEMAIILMRNCIITAILAIFALSSCQKAFNVSSVKFSKDGGTQTIEVVTYDAVEINDGNANYGKSEYDENTGVYKTTLEWLSVEYNKSTNKCFVIATKNDSGKKRTFYLEAMYGDLKTSIPVIQDK